MLPRYTFIRTFIIWGSNPFLKYSHLKPICINKGSFLKECAHSKKIRFHLEMHALKISHHVLGLCKTDSFPNVPYSGSQPFSSQSQKSQQSCYTPEHLWACQWVHPHPVWKQDLGRHLFLHCFIFQRKHGCVLSRGELWNAPVRSLTMEQSGFPVILKHVPHPQPIRRQCQVKPTALLSLKQLFWGWMKLVPQVPFHFSYISFCPYFCLCESYSAHFLRLSWLPS